MNETEYKFERGDAVQFFDASGNRYFGRIVEFDGELMTYVACPQGRMFVATRNLEPYQPKAN